MATSRVRPELPLVVIVGPTASGKTSLAIKLAKRFRGEIISADSRAVYKGLSVGTAKPSLAEQDDVPHWGIDLVNVNQRFTAADFQAYAKEKIVQIRERGNMPILVGGTGLYIDAVVYNFQFPSVGNNTAVRDMLTKLSIRELHNYCIENNIMLPENLLNKRHVVNQILRGGATLRREVTPVKFAIIVGITTEKEVLYTRIQSRAEQIFSSGVIDEAITVAQKYGWESEAMTGNIYPLIKDYLQGLLTKAELEEKFALKDRRLAKRQMTWFKRDEHIKWLSLDRAYTYIARRLDRVNNSWYHTPIKREK